MLKMEVIATGSNKQYSVESALIPSILRLTFGRRHVWYSSPWRVYIKWHL